MVRESRDVDYSYGGKTLAIRQSGEFCDSCGEGIFNAEESERYLTEASLFRTKVDMASLAPTEVRRIRKKLGLTQRQAGDLFGGGIRAFSQYERGETRQGKALDTLLRLLDRHPELLTEVCRKDAA